MLVTQLKSFFVVARLGSVTLAAKQLGLSQPTVTTQIRALEELYGVELFHRSSGRLNISDAGVRLLPLVDQLLQQEINVEFALRNAGEPQQGSLRLGATAPYYILDIVQRYRQRFPLVDISIGAGNSRQMIDALQEYRVDLATSSHLETDPRLHRIELGSDPLVLVLHRNHPLAQLEAVPLAALADCLLLSRERGSKTRQLSEDMLAAAGVQPQASMEIASREALREAVIRQMGVCVFARNEVSVHPELRALPFVEATPQVPEYLYCLKDRRRARLIESFLAECKPS
ncbi:LysR family transcriptional regulator [Paucibacter sp. KBW04]|uniref:LysR substrate-binding domain-containing protein n=1 Tax=Paucibacter sp. KBW04 TaxID=2153361 RepID=UPI000F577937|nr:LysR substrate-binding domain-containing protein [Paucibacter sp. KBW04]RQO62079.1 LysR family transcriptional regulator [Paucibacter sp. KBW04]